MSNQLHVIPLGMPGYIAGVIPPVVDQAITAEINSMLENNFQNSVPFNQNLAGSIEHEYRLDASRDVVERFMADVAREYWQAWYRPDLAKKQYGFDNKGSGASLWVNFQKKYEHNPLHSHSGMLSFVIWHTIPYELDAERALPQNRQNPKSSYSPAGAFIFNCVDITNYMNPLNQHYINLGKSNERNFVMFHSATQHSVMPFYTSDDYRISVAGNLIIKE